MTDINRLISLNVQLEGLLKVLLERDNIHARSALAEKFEEYSEALRSYLDESAATPAETAAVAAEAAALADEAQATEVKDLEAAESEVEDETDAATAAIERGEAEEAAGVPVAQECEPTVNSKLLKAFTLNDKFRFRRELFNGDDEDFADTLSLLAHMPSYDEAVDFLTNDLLWDKRNIVVNDFFAILKANMPA